MNDKMQEWLILFGFGFLLLLVIPEWASMLLFFMVCCGGLIISVVKLKNQDTFTAGTLVYISVALLGGLGAIRILGYFVANFLWVAITFITICTILSLGFLVFLAAKLGIWFYQLYKSRTSLSTKD